MVRSFHYDSQKEEGKDFAKRVTAAMYPKGAKHCMMHCKFATGYDDGSGAYCNNKDAPDYEERVRSWHTVDGCSCFEEGERIIECDEVESPSLEGEV